MTTCKPTIRAGRSPKFESPGRIGPFCRTERPRSHYLRSVQSGRNTEKRDPAVESVLRKLTPEDREVLQEALARAEKTEAELRYLADHDPLTGLVNRRRFRAELDQYV